MKKTENIFPLWDIKITGEFRKKAPEIRENNIPAAAPVSATKPPAKNNIAEKEPYDIVKIRKPRKKKERPTPAPQPSKKCIACCEEFFKAERISSKAWEKRKTCSLSCGSKLRKRSGPIRKESKPKICLICDKTFYRPKTSTLDAWKKKTICSAVCKKKYIQDKKKEPLQIEIPSRIKISDLTISIPHIVLLELQVHAAKNYVSTNDVILVAMTEYLLKAHPDNEQFKNTVKKIFSYRKPEKSSYE